MPADRRLIRTLDAEIIDGQARLVEGLPKPLDVGIVEQDPNNPDIDSQLAHCVQQDTAAYNELIATTLATIRTAKTADIQLDYITQCRALLKERRQMLLKPTEYEAAPKGKRTLLQAPEARPEDSTRALN